MQAHSRNRLVIFGVVLAVLAIVVAKAVLTPGTGSTPGATSAEATSGGAVADANGGAGGATPTSAHNDAIADYEAALKTGKPVYVLFHSLTCQPCVEISGVADKVVPGYEGRVVFVNAITDDPSGQRLASKFAFQYIPTSFFLKPGGAVADSHTGVLSEAEMKARLDELAAE